MDRKREYTKDKEAGSIRCVRIVLLIAAVLFLIAGIRNGSMDAMFVRAVNICTECIGLG